MLARVVDAKSEHNFGEKRRPRRRVETKRVQARLQCVIFRKEILDAAVDIGAPLSEHLPLPRRTLIFKCHRDVVRRPAGTSIENVGGDRTHTLECQVVGAVTPSRLIRRATSSASGE